MELRCLASGLEFEANLGAKLVSEGRVERAESALERGELLPLFSTHLIDLQEVNADISDHENYEDTSRG